MTEIYKYLEGFCTADELAAECKRIGAKGFMRVPSYTPLSDLICQRFRNVDGFRVFVYGEPYLSWIHEGNYRTDDVPQVVIDFTKRFCAGEWPELCIF